MNLPTFDNVIKAHSVMIESSEKLIENVIDFMELKTNLTNSTFVPENKNIYTNKKCTSKS